MGTIERNQKVVKARTEAAIKALTTEVEACRPKGHAWPAVGERVKLLSPHPLAGQKGIVIRHERSLLFPEDEARPVVLLTGGEQTFITQRGEWKPA